MHNCLPYKKSQNKIRSKLTNKDSWTKYFKKTIKICTHGAGPSKIFSRCQFHFFKKLNSNSACTYTQFITCSNPIYFPVSKPDNLDLDPSLYKKIQYPHKLISSRTTNTYRSYIPFPCSTRLLDSLHRSKPYHKNITWQKHAETLVSNLTGTLLSSLMAHSQTKLESQSTEIGEFNTFGHIFTVYVYHGFMSEIGQVCLKATLLDSDCKIKVLPIDLQIEAVA